MDRIHRPGMGTGFVGPPGRRICPKCGETFYTHELLLEDNRQSPYLDALVCRSDYVGDGIVDEPVVPTETKLNTGWNR